MAPTVFFALSFYNILTRQQFSVAEWVSLRRVYVNLMPKIMPKVRK